MRQSCFLLVLLACVTTEYLSAQLVPAVPQTGNQQQTPASANTTKDPARPEVPRATGSADVDPTSYQIGALDEIRVSVWREPDLSGIYKVRPDGKITFPFINEMTVLDMTPDMLKEALVKGYSQYVNAPQVQVDVVAVRSKRFFLVGKFVRVGEVPIERRLTIMEAIAAAGGFQPFANQSKVVVLRGQERIKFNYKEVLKGKKLEQNILVKNGDYIIAQ